MHLSFGTQYVSGLAVTDDGDGTISSGSGVIRDEDIHLTIGAQTVFQKLYREGAGGPWKKKTLDGFPYTLGVNSRVEYNLDTAGTWSVEQAPNNSDYCNILVYALNDVRASEQVVCIMDDTLHGTLNSAKANIESEIASLLAGGLNFQEFAPIAAITVRTNGDIKVVTDLRQPKSSTGGTTNNHESLGGLLGGEAAGHYHLTQSQLNILLGIESKEI